MQRRTRVSILEHGGPEVLSVIDDDLAAPNRGEVQLRQTAVGLNFVDIYHRSGHYPTSLPTGIGLAAVGMITALGSDVQGLRIGDRVGYATGPIGAYATAANIPSSRIVAIPPQIPDDIAGATILRGLTAEFLLRRCYRVKAGDRILIQAAAGGLGQLLSQWALRLGATVIGTAGSEAKLEIAKRAGCAHVILYKSEDVPARVRELTGGDGVNVVYDGVGRDTWASSLDSLARRGVMVSFGDASGSPPSIAPADLWRRGSLYLTRPSIMHYAEEPHELREGATAYFHAVVTGAIEVAPPHRFPLTRANDAHGELECGAISGSAVLIPT